MLLLNVFWKYVSQILSVLVSSLSLCYPQHAWINYGQPSYNIPTFHWYRVPTLLRRSYIPPLQDSHFPLLQGTILTTFPLPTDTGYQSSYDVPTLHQYRAPTLFNTMFPLPTDTGYQSSYNVPTSHQHRVPILQCSHFPPIQGTNPLTMFPLSTNTEHQPSYDVLTSHQYRVPTLLRCSHSPLIQGSNPLKGMEHVPNIFISFDKYLFLEVINILIRLVYLNNMKYHCSKNIWILSKNISIQPYWIWSQTGNEAIL